MDRRSGSDTSDAAAPRPDGPAPMPGPDGPAPSCRGVQFSNPVLVANVNSALDDFAPEISSNGLALYFSSRRAGGVGAKDIWVATRGAASATFGTPVLVDGVNSVSDDSDPFLNLDGRRLFFTSSRTGTLGGADVWIASRPSDSSPFSVQRHVTEVSGPTDDADPWVSADGLRLYFDRREAAGPVLLMASRTDPDGTFGAPVVLLGLDGHSPRMPSLSVDELEMFFTSVTVGGVGRHDIWVAARTSVTAAFSTPVNVTVLNTPRDDGESSLSRDGRTLYFNRDADFGGGQNADIWMATRTCAP